jgi:hypothetical protein
MRSNVQLWVDANVRQTVNMQLHRRNGVLPALFVLVNQIPASAGKDYPLHNPNAFAGGQIKNEIELNDFE